MFNNEDAREIYGLDQPEFSEMQDMNEELYQDEDPIDFDTDEFPFFDDDDSEYDCDTDLYGEFYDWE